MPALVEDASADWIQYGLWDEVATNWQFLLPYSTRVTAGTVEVSGYLYLVGATTTNLTLVTTGPTGTHTQSHTFSGPFDGLTSHVFTLNSGQRDNINLYQWGVLTGNGFLLEHPFSMVAGANYSPTGFFIDSLKGSFTCAYSTDVIATPPTSATLSASWQSTGGFPMQRKWVSIAYNAGFRLCYAAGLTDGSGNVSFDIEDNIEYSGATQIKCDVGRALIQTTFSPFQRGVVFRGPANCDTSVDDTNANVWGSALSEQGIIYPPSNNSAAPIGGISAPGVFESGSGSCSLETNFKAKIRAGAWCEGRKHFILNGITLGVTGLFGSESHTTDANGDIELTAVDPTTVYDVTPSGLPACGALSGYAAWSQPAHVNYSLVDGSTPAVLAAANGLNTLTGTDFCGAYSYATFDALTCASCGTLASTRLAADSFDNSIILAWADSSNRLKVSHHRHPVSAEALADSAQGWDAAITLESANASDVGIVYLQNRRVYLCYDLSGAKKYRTNDLIGYAASSSDWSASGTPNPALSRHSCSGRAFSAAWRFRATGNSGAGDIKFSWCGDRTGADWNAEVTVVAATARGPYCGGAYLGNKMGCLYTNDADNKIYWIESTDRDTWGTPADTTMTGTVASLLRDQKGVLVGLIWDAAGKKCRACRSRDRGATWEKDTSDISVLPALDVPPVLVYVKHYIFAVYVVGDQPMFAYSIDSGVTWL